MMENMRKAIKAHEDESNRKFAAAIQGMAAGQLLKSWYYRDNMTEKAMQSLQAMDSETIPDKWIIEKMEKKHARKEAKAAADRMEKVRTAEGYDLPETINISVEWKRSSTWGYNPTATVTADHRRTTGTASGCGYDKESAAIASAFNQHPEIMRIIYEYAETGQAFPYGIHTWAGVPSFDGGCGVSVFYEIFKVCGYEFRQVASGKLYNAYTITKKEAKSA